MSLLYELFVIFLLFLIVNIFPPAVQPLLHTFKQLINKDLTEDLLYVTFIRSDSIRRGVSRSIRGSIRTELSPSLLDKLLIQYVALVLDVIRQNVLF